MSINLPETGSAEIQPPIDLSALANQIIDTFRRWLSPTEEEHLIGILGSIDVLNMKLPQNTKILFQETDYASGSGCIIYGKGVCIYLTRELKQELLNLSADKALEKIVEIAQQIITSTPKGNTEFRNSLRESLSNR